MNKLAPIIGEMYIHTTFVTLFKIIYNLKNIYIDTNSATTTLSGFNEID